MVSGHDPEGLRLYDRLLELRRSADNHELRLGDALRRLDVLEPKVDELEQSGRLATALARQAKRDRELVLTIGQKLGGSVLGAAMLVDVILRTVYR